MPKARHGLRLATLAAVLLSGRALHAQTARAVATFNNIGVELEYAAPPPAGTQVALYIKRAGTTNGFRGIHPLSRVAATRFAGSAFGLSDDTTYTIRLEPSGAGTNVEMNVTTRADAFADATDTVYHVSPTGDDANSGLSTNAPFKTLGHALSQAYAGDKILLHDGRFHEGDLSAPRSGTAAEPIVIRNAPGAEPVLDGTDTNFVAGWTLHDADDNVYRMATTRTPRIAFVNGGHFFHYLDYDDLRTNQWNQPGGYYADGAHIYARFAGGAAPGTNVFTIPRYTTGITIDNRAHIHIIGLEFCYYGYGTYHRGIYIDGGDSNLVSHCTFHHNGIGITIKRAADFNTVQYCRFNESPVSTWNWHAVKSGGVGYEAGGFAVYSSDQPNEGNVIRYNRFDDHFDASGTGSENLAGPTRNLDYHDNLIDVCSDDAISMDGAVHNNRVYNNTFKGFLTGVSVAPAAGGPTYVFRNVFCDWHSVGSYEGYPFKFNVTSPLTIDWVHIYHNTCYTESGGQDGFLFKQYSSWSNVVSRNNIFAGTDHALDSWSTVNPVDFDYDNLYTTHGSKFIRWAGSSYAAVSAFYAATGQEQHGMSYPPGFADAGNGDYQLAHDSPLIDRGVPIPGINDAFVGSAPDVGAFEFVALATNVSASGSSVISEWQARSGTVYRLQHTSGLRNPAWTDTGAPVTATTHAVSFSDPAGSATQRYYRVRAETGAPE